MAKKLCMVTGATAGIGLETAKALAGMGHRIVGVSRSREKCELVQNRLREETGNTKVEFLAADLSSQKEIRDLAKEFTDRHDRLDILVNNAGALFKTRRESADNIEMTFALNHLGYFLLTDLLLDVLKAGDSPRIVNVASDAHRRDVMDFDDLQGSKSYSGWTAYCRSKLANVLYTHELAQRLHETSVTVNALHPGVVATSFFKSGSFPFLIRFFVNLLCIGPKKGARTAVYLTSSPEVGGVTGKYFVKCRAVESSPTSYDKDAAARLWKASEELIGK